MGSVDGDIILRKELAESVNRIRAAKKGIKISQISPEHDSRYYLPEKEKYFS